MTTTCLLAWAAVLLLSPVLILLNLTESRSVKIRRARANGHTWKAIAARYGVSPSTAKRWAAV
jgi:DNA-binding NarL/FixJ family response regulator